MSDSKRFIKNFSSGVILSILTKVLSFFTTFLLLLFWGTSRELDIFVIVSGFIVLINIIIQRTFTNAFPTVFLKIEDKNERDIFTQSMMTFTLVTSLLTFVVVFLTSKYIVTLLAPGFADTDLDKSATLLKILSISLVINIITSLLISFFRAHENITPIYLKDVLINAIILVGILLFGSEIKNVVGYYVIAYFVSLLYVFLLFKRDYRLKIRIQLNSLFNKNIKLFYALALPIFLTSGTNELKNIADKIFASYLDAGAIAALNFSYRIIGLPVNILGGVLVTVIYARLVKQSKTGEFKKNIWKLTNLTFLVVIPLSFFVYSQSSLITSFFTAIGQGLNENLLDSSLAAFSFCIFANTMLLIMNTIFYSDEKMNTTLVLSIIVTILNVLFNFLFIERWRVAGIAFSTTLSSIITFFIGTYILSRRIGWKFLKLNFTHLIGYSLLSIISLQILKLDLLQISTAGNSVMIILELLLKSISFISFYLMCIYLIKVFYKGDLLND